MLLEVKELKKYYPIKQGIFKIGGYVHAVDGISFSIGESETLGLVGESGCGKSTVAKVILKLENLTSGNVYFKDIDVKEIHGQQLISFRKNLQIVFQDPYGSLNPRMRVNELVAEPLWAQGNVKKKEVHDRICSVLDKVGLGAEYLSKYPHQLSGGQRQRVSIARALVLNPKMIILDEPVSALDVSIQAQILNLMLWLKETFNLSYLFISHDLSVVEYISDRVAVMYMGKIVEIGSTQEIFANTIHPYTQELMLAVPSLEPGKKGGRRTILGEPLNPSNPPLGCRFYNRCSFVRSICREEEPYLQRISENHSVACHGF